MVALSGDYDCQFLTRAHQVPMVVEEILVKVTNIAKGTQIDKIMESEDIDCRHPEGTWGLVEAGLLDWTDPGDEPCPALLPT